MAEEQQNDHKKDVKAGIVIAILIVVAILIFQGVSNIKITKKKKVVQQQTATTTQVADTAKNTKQVSKEVTTESTVKVDDNSKVIKKVLNPSKLDFSAAEMETTGFVKSKEMYLQDTQVLYLLNITIGAGASSIDVKYYCTYDTYVSVKENDILTVKYQQLSDSAFGVTSVSK